MSKAILLVNLGSPDSPSVPDVRRLLSAVPEGPYRLMIELMYGSGLRLLECCRLRVKDVDFERGQIVVREGKGDKDRAVPLPESLIDRLRTQVQSAVLWSGIQT